MKAEQRSVDSARSPTWRLIDHPGPHGPAQRGVFVCLSARGQAVHSPAMSNNSLLPILIMIRCHSVNGDHLGLSHWPGSGRCIAHTLDRCCYLLMHTGINEL
ncbi:MAG: hypothetical protein CL859_06160 [Cyanobium sp. ARS6]|nr:hypothetical protein [Cyanobium sp. ARS6]